MLLTKEPPLAAQPPAPADAASPRVLVVQSGARHSYAIPAAFAETGMLEALYTDLCAGRGVGRLAGLGASLPGGIGALSRRLAARRPPQAVLARTRTDDLETLRYERQVRKLADPELRRQAVDAHVLRRGERMAEWGLGDATHVFNIFGEGGALLERARARGLPVLSDVIIAPSAYAIQWAEYEAFPDWGPPPRRPPGSPSDFDLTHRMLETTDLFVCPSSFVARDLVANWGADPKAIRIVPYAVADRWFELSPRPTPGRVLFVGSADRRKGVHYLSWAAEALRRRGRRYDFRVAGNVDETVRTHPDSAALTFLGRLPRTEVKHEFELADVFVLPTLAEGSATVVYEAMAAGVPVVTTEAAGSVISNGVDGIIVPERDPAALADAIERLVEDRPLRGRMGAAAHANARRFGWKSYANALCDLVRATPSPDRRGGRLPIPALSQ